MQIDQLRKDFSVVFGEWIAWGESTEEEKSEWGAFIAQSKGDEDMMKCIAGHLRELAVRHG